MSRGPLRTATVASVIVFAIAAPAATVDASATSTCAKQSRAVISAKKAVARAQKAKASNSAARKQRARRVKVAKVKHVRAKKALAACKAKAEPVPVPLPTPTPTPEPMPVAPILSVAATTVGALEGFAVTVAAPAPPAGTVYRLAFRTLGTVNSTCSFLVIRGSVGSSSSLLLQTARPWCVGPGRISLHQAVEASNPLPRLGEQVASVDVVVNPS